MVYLFLVSLIWAFSFGLTKGKLAGLDPSFISAARLALALLVFLPFLRFRGLNPRLAAALAAIGAVQFGVMYLALNASYRYLQSYEVVLLTITTPILVTLFADALDRTLGPRALLAAGLAVMAALIAIFWIDDFRVSLTKTGLSLSIQWRELKTGLTGIALVQLSNAAFAVGQVAYQRIRVQNTALRDRDIFGLLYAGATAVALVAMLLRPGSMPVTLTATQVATLAYLGILASGLCFFLWNVGATRVSSGTLAVMNNAKAPLGVAVSLLFFGESAPLLPLLASLAALALALWLVTGRPRTS